MLLGSKQGARGVENERKGTRITVKEIMKGLRRKEIDGEQVCKICWMRPGEGRVRKYIQEMMVKGKDVAGRRQEGKRTQQEEGDEESN